MIVVLARASARYSGRIDAELALGDICLLVKDYDGGGDGSVVLHDMGKGMSPRNWMPAGSELKWNNNEIIIEHIKREEKLEIWLDTVYKIESFPSTLQTTLTKLGAEREFSDRLSESLHLVEENLFLEAREWRSSAGPIDLLCLDIEGNPVALEVKRRKIDPNAVWQMRRYIHALQETEAFRGKPIRGIMVAPSLQESAKKMLASFEDITFQRVKWEELCL